MDQTTALRSGDRQAQTQNLINFIAAAIDAARVEPKPFHHLEFDGIFPNHIYAAMLDAMPETADYRQMHGRSRETKGRVKIDLFPEYIRHLPPAKLEIWRIVGAALRSEPVKNAFRRKLAPALEGRFGKSHASVGMYPIPVLTRDVTGYSIPLHTDTHWKGITVQLYLPRDDATLDIGTIFHDVLPDGSRPKTRQMPFAPNSGYAFAVGQDTWHSVDTVHDRVKTRDSILLTYFVDQGPLMVLRNRVKRVGNFILNEIRNRT